MDMGYVSVAILFVLNITIFKIWFGYFQTLHNESHNQNSVLNKDIKEFSK